MLEIPLRVIFLYVFLLQSIENNLDQRIDMHILIFLQTSQKAIVCQITFW